MKDTVDWQALMVAGIRDLRLKPDEFWALTPAELMLMLGVDDASAPLSRSRFDELLHRFPDRIGEKEYG